VITVERAPGSPLKGVAPAGPGQCRPGRPAGGL